MVVCIVSAEGVANDNLVVQFRHPFVPHTW